MAYATSSDLEKDHRVLVANELGAIRDSCRSGFDSANFVSFTG